MYWRPSLYTSVYHEPESSLETTGIIFCRTHNNTRALNFLGHSDNTYRLHRLDRLECFYRQPYRLLIFQARIGIYEYEELPIFGNWMPKNPTQERAAPEPFPP
jgi:hypothetical protein